MKPKTLFLIGFLLLIATTLPLFRGRPESIDWHTSLESALDEARTEQKLVLAFLYTDWCGYCRQMDQVTFKDPSVVSQLADGFVWLRLNAEQDSDGIQLNRAHRVSGFPTILILDQNKSEVDRLQGFMPPERFLESARNSLRMTAGWEP